MPKHIDPTERKQLIAHATWKIMLQQGIDSTSVRTIAKEAGLSLGALRYYFSTQEELMLYAEALIFERLTEKTIEIFQKEQPPLEKIVNVLMAFLPINEELAVETKARLLFKLRGASSGKAFQEERDAALQTVKNIMSNLILLNLLKRELNVPLETDKLIHLLDGMVLDAIIRPQHATIEQQRKMIVSHLNTICKDNNAR